MLSFLQSLCLAEASQAFDDFFHYGNLLRGVDVHRAQELSHYSLAFEPSIDDIDEETLTRLVAQLAIVSYYIVL